MSEGDEVNSIMADVEYGHSYHCAGRLNWGDGECECGLLEREEIAASISYQDPVALAPSYAEHYGSDIWDADQGGHFE